jgi:photosynthetic reaction center cytochrome c subunit
MNARARSPCSRYGPGGLRKPPVEVVQRGYRGTGMEQVINPDGFGQRRQSTRRRRRCRRFRRRDRRPGTSTRTCRFWVISAPPSSTASWRRSPTGCRRKRAVPTVTATGWLCRDDKYTKKVARVMIAMTQRANEAWGDKHVAPTGVTCYTCHRGKNVPEYVWVKEPVRQCPASLAMYIRRDRTWRCQEAGRLRVAALRPLHPLPRG